jgi:hypothetical protein
MATAPSSDRLSPMRPAAGLSLGRCQSDRQGGDSKHTEAAAACHTAKKSARRNRNNSMIAIGLRKASRKNGVLLPDVGCIEDRF